MLDINKVLPGDWRIDTDVTGDIDLWCGDEIVSRSIVLDLKWIFGYIVEREKRWARQDAIDTVFDSIKKAVNT